MIKIYQIFICEDAGWVTKRPEDFKNEIEDHSNEFRKDMNTDEIIGKIKELNIGGELETEDLKFKCVEMTEDQFNNLDEWGGW